MAGTDDQGGEPDGWLPADTMQKPQVRDQDDQGGEPDGWLPADTMQKPQVRDLMIKEGSLMVGYQPIPGKNLR